MKKIDLNGDGIHGVVVAKLINELIDHVEELEAKAREEHPLPSMDELLDRAYQKGRADKYQEITANCMLLTEEQVKDIGNDAIEEFAHELKETFNSEFPLGYYCTKPFFSLDYVRALVDRVSSQMKEGKHENI